MEILNICAEGFTLVFFNLFVLHRFKCTRGRVHINYNNAVEKRSRIQLVCETMKLAVCTIWVTFHHIV